jgi:antitoxin component of RelBE/YafQ-DinJ toxin-antitoxin module
MGYSRARMHTLFRARIDRKLLRQTDEICVSMGITPQDVVRMAFAELVRRGCLPWTPGQVHQIRLDVPASIEDGAQTVEVAIPARLVWDALQKRKAPGDDAEGFEDDGEGEDQALPSGERRPRTPAASTR